MDTTMPMPNDIESLIKVHQKQLGALRAERAQLGEQLEQVEKAIGMTEGAILGIEQVDRMQKDRDSANPTTLPATPAPVEPVEAYVNGADKAREAGTAKGKG
jgi:hypothetical protein